jgi:mannose-6-phosphate isomerase-like protein (cupin superfamily)
VAESPFREWQSVHSEGDIQVDYVAGERLGAVRELAGAGRVGPRHRHHRTEELMMVTEGELDLTIGEEKRTLGPGDVAVVPPGTEHELFTAGGATYYLLFAPGLPRDDFILCPR